MQNAGAYLKSVREEKGYSIAEVSKNTKISPAVLRALEEGRLDNIDPVYLKGFLKMYCRFLRADWQEFLKEYPVTTVAKYPHKPEGDGGQPNSRSQKLSPVQNYRAIKKEKEVSSGAGPMAPDVKESVKFPDRDKQWEDIKNSLVSLILGKKKIILAGLAVVAGVFFMLLVLKGCFSHPAVQKKAAAPLSPKRPSKTTSPAQTAPRPVPSKTPTQHPVLSVAPAPQESKPEEITLVIRAKERSFIKVKVDGRTIYQGLLRKGDAESWNAKDNIELSVGNAAAVALEVDGKVFSSLGRKGQTLKNILINRAGLKINP